MTSRSSASSKPPLRKSCPTYTGVRTFRSSGSQQQSAYRTMGGSMNHARITRLIALPAMLLVLAGGTAATPIAIAAAAPVANAGTARAAADQVRTAERTLLRAAVNGDTRTAGALLAPGLQQIDVTGTPETRADYLATIGGGVDFVTLKPIKPISVRVYGNHA